jgi:hypothetical protein
VAATPDVGKSCKKTSSDFRKLHKKLQTFKNDRLAESLLFYGNRSKRENRLAATVGELNASGPTTLQ